MLTSVEQLERVYGKPSERALRKEIGFLNEDYRAFVEASPFVVLVSVGPEGTDCSPKGDAPGFVRVIDERTLAIPDRLGNNRIDNLRNIVADSACRSCFSSRASGRPCGSTGVPKSLMMRRFSPRLRSRGKIQDRSSW
jgi:predicted pyridoxine 5'-phosphate oxidase superfamily flavin-nucleotide-binding protein